MSPARSVTLACAWAALVLVLSPAAAHAQIEGTRNPVPHDQVVSLNPFLVLFEWFNAEYERKVGPASSAGGGASFISFDGGDEEYVSVNGFWRYYPQEAALSGFFVGPRAGVYRVSDPDESATMFGVGFELGYTWLLGRERHFAISLGAGATRLFGGDLDDIEATIPTLRLVNVGWAF